MEVGSGGKEKNKNWWKGGGVKGEWMVKNGKNGTTSTSTNKETAMGRHSFFHFHYVQTGKPRECTGSKVAREVPIFWTPYMYLSIVSSALAKNWGRHTHTHTHTWTCQM